MAHKEHRESDKAARAEAYSLFQAMKHGVDLSDVMHIEPETLRTLKLFCKVYPAHAYIVVNALNFRRRVRIYLDTLLAGEDVGVPVDEEDEADTAESATAEAEVCGIQGAEEPIIPQKEAQEPRLRRYFTSHKGVGCDEIHHNV